MAEVDLTALLGMAAATVERELGQRPRVQDKGGGFDVLTLPARAREWHRLSDAVAVAADLKNSTAITTAVRRQASAAGVYEASTGVLAGVLDAFGARFIAIQGDGAFGLFWGDRPQPRALCAAITIATFSSRLVRGLTLKWGNGLPATGLRVGVAMGTLLVKQIGGSRSSREPVWAGHAVNYATKAAAQAGTGHVVVTKHVWDWVKGNDYLLAPCPCRRGAVLWKPAVIGAIRAPDRGGRQLRMGWCEQHGPAYCDQIMDRGRSRSDVTAAERARLSS